MKWPSRERPTQFIETLRGYIDKSFNPKDITYMITLDQDDPHLYKYIDWGKTINTESEIIIKTGLSTCKIHACNRDMQQAPEFDILVLASDDMICQQRGWDSVLVQEMQNNFPDTDGVLYHPDGYTKLNTMCILGRKYFERFGYIYHPAYQSLWCDNEFMEVADYIGRQFRSDTVLFKHEHFSTNGNIRMDALMIRTQKFYHQDQRVYNQHKLNNFGLNV